MELYNLITKYRSAHKLPAIPLSKSLTQVAKEHAKDLAVNRPDTANCNPHSWSGKGKWKGCCYTPDHKQAQCMWDKPKEIAGYGGMGFEIAYFSGLENGKPAEVDVQDALKTWQASPGHNPVLINSGKWKDAQWKAIGIGIYGGYVCVWFGEETDPKGYAELCK
jgi:hypothetical protein